MQLNQVNKNQLKKSILLSILTVGSSSAFGFFIDGNGHFATKGETRVVPDFQKNQGTYQANELSVDIHGEIRANDRASFNLRLGLFEDPSSAYLGNDGQPTECEQNGGKDNTKCEDRHQSTLNPGTKPYKPVIREAYAKYAFSYCILTAGRRSRDVGLGLLHSSAKKPFEQDPSIFDGVTCDINLQKQQDLGFYFGIDIAKQVSIYFANILGSESKTDVKYLDLYTGLFFGKLAFKNELLIRMGKTADPNVVGNGGRDRDTEVDKDNNAAAVNNIQSIGLAGELEFTWNRSGAALGPSEFNEGNVTKNTSYFNYAFAPGDADGYLNGQVMPGSDPKAVNKLGIDQRNNKSTAMAFHKNYKPALLLFNGKRTSRSMNVPGVYNPERVMNASVYALGHRYESMENGNVDVRFITGRLLEGMNSDVAAYYDTFTKDTRAVGYKGKNLGYELDITYSWQYRKEVELASGIAGALPGNAFEISPTDSAAFQYGLFGSFALKF
ncbi:MAG: hypothetical protein NT027_08380 [Proteobacteria bacterium]|nr:hypothetical protein [Pseudomonadota bacterium]